MTWGRIGCGARGHCGRRRYRIPARKCPGHGQPAGLRNRHERCRDLNRLASAPFKRAPRPPLRVSQRQGRTTRRARKRVRDMRPPRFSLQRDFHCKDLLPPALASNCYGAQDQEDEAPLAWRNLVRKILTPFLFFGAKARLSGAGAGQFAWHAKKRLFAALQASAKIRSTRVPSPGALSIATLPPCNSTMLLTMARPSPMRPRSKERALSLR